MEPFHVGTGVCLFAVLLIDGRHAIIASTFRELSRINGISNVWFLGHADSHVPHGTLCVGDISKVALFNAIEQPNFTE